MSFNFRSFEQQQRDARHNENIINRIGILGDRYHTHLLKGDFKRSDRLHKKLMRMINKIIE